MGSHPEDMAVTVATAHAEHEPDEVLGADEPRTPMWLPLVGGIVFVLGIVGFVATRPPGKTAVELQKQAAAAAAELRAKQAPPEPAVVAPPAQAPNAAQPGMPMPQRPPGRGG